MKHTIYDNETNQKYDCENAELESIKIPYEYEDSFESCWSLMQCHHITLCAYNSPTIKSKQSPLTQLTFLNLKRLTGGVYAEIRQAHILK